MDLRIETLNDSNIDKWEIFNHEMDEGTFYHTIKWKRILESLGHIPHYYLIFSGDEVVAICPFFEINIKGFKGIMPLPDSDYNHIVIKEDNQHNIIDFIRKELEYRAKKNSWSFIILNSLDKNFEEKLNTFYYPNFSMGTMSIDLENLSPAKIWDEIFTAKKAQRTYIKRFKKDGFEIRYLDSVDGIKTFYKYYLKNIRHIKGTEYPYSHFEDIYNLYSPNNRTLALLYKQDFIAGGFLNFLDESKKTMHTRYIAINRDVPNKYHVQYYLLWETIKKAYELKCKRLCLGSNVKDQNHRGYKLKSNFGADYKDNYSVLIPTSKIFKLGHSVYRSLYRWKQDEKRKIKLPKFKI